MMAKVRGTSNAPLVLVIVGGVLRLPAAICSGVCAAAVDMGEDSGLTEFYLYGTAIISIALIVLACFTKKSPMLAGILMLLCTACGVILFAVTMNLLGIIAMVVTLIGGILSLVQKKEAVQ